MKASHVQAYRTDALATLHAVNAEVGQDFHTLRSSQVEALLAHADSVRYRVPKGANGSRARYFYQLLQRRAA